MCNVIDSNLSENVRNTDAFQRYLRYHDRNIIFWKYFQIFRSERRKVGLLFYVWIIMWCAIESKHTHYRPRGRSKTYVTWRLQSIYTICHVNYYYVWRINFKLNRTRSKIAGYACRICFESLDDIINNYFLWNREELQSCRRGSKVRTLNGPEIWNFPVNSRGEQAGINVA